MIPSQPLYAIEMGLFIKLTVAIIERSSRTRKKAKHRGIITSQSFRPESHCTSSLWSLLAASDTARSASVATGLSLVAATWALPLCFSGSGLCWSEAGDADRGEAIVDMQNLLRSSWLSVLEGVVRLAKKSDWYS